jgi:hypothetical protein
MYPTEFRFHSFDFTTHVCTLARSNRISLSSKRVSFQLDTEQMRHDWNSAVLKTMADDDEKLADDNADEMFFTYPRDVEAKVTLFVGESLVEMIFSLDLDHRRWSNVPGKIHVVLVRLFHLD